MLTALAVSNKKPPLLSVVGVCHESEFKCEENANAIIYLKSALDELRKRTNKRESRGVEGTHIA